MWGAGVRERNIIAEMLEEELDRNGRARAAYAAELDSLPRGSVRVKTRGDRAYCYLKRREGGRTVTEYVGVADKVEEELRSQVARRKEVEAAIGQLDSERRYIERALAL